MTFWKRQHERDWKHASRWEGLRREVANLSCNWVVVMDTNHAFLTVIEPLAERVNYHCVLLSRFCFCCLFVFWGGGWLAVLMYSVCLFPWCKYSDHSCLQEADSVTSAHTVLKTGGMLPNIVCKSCLRNSVFKKRTLFKDPVPTTARHSLTAYDHEREAGNRIFQPGHLSR